MLSPNLLPLEELWQDRSGDLERKGFGRSPPLVPVYPSPPAANPSVPLQPVYGRFAQVRCPGSPPGRMNSKPVLAATATARSIDRLATTARGLRLGRRRAWRARDRKAREDTDFTSFPSFTSSPSFGNTTIIAEPPGSAKQGVTRTPAHATCTAWEVCKAACDPKRDPVPPSAGGGPPDRGVGAIDLIYLLVVHERGYPYLVQRPVVGPSRHGRVFQKRERTV